jgi:pimeloyl-ACP methyl ester carboxylesterase
MAARTLILDGFLGRPGRWERLRRTIVSRGSEAEIYRYDCTGRTGLPMLGRQLLKYIDRLNEPVNLVGYSMGGLVIRTAWMLQPSLPLRRAVFINSPHRGTWLAHLWPFPGVRQMRPNDAHLARLDAVPWTVPTLTIYNRFDGIVIPASSTRLPHGGDHFACPEPAHIWPVWSGTVHRRVADFVTAPEPEAACPST